MPSFLKIKNLSVEIGEKQIIKDLDFQLKKGETQVLLGPNASGKSTLVGAIMGLSPFHIKKGQILFQGKDITKLSPERRARLGISLSFQNPPSISGVHLDTLLDNITVPSSKKRQKDILQQWGDSLLSRDVNVGFSGGEKKISEILQIASLNSQLVILDEIDSGLDIQKLKEFSSLIKKYFSSSGKSLLVITHQGDILRYLKPDWVNVILKGKIICRSQNWKEVWQTIKKHGYEKCKKCSFSLS